MQIAHYKNPPESYQHAKYLRKIGPVAERLLWNALCMLKEEQGLKFRRQQPLHPYIVDFACMKARLAIELDGFSHDARQDYDARREADIRKMGWTMMRFSNDEVLSNLEGVVVTIIEKAKQLAPEQPSPNPSRKGRGTDRACGNVRSRKPVVECKPSGDLNLMMIENNH